MVFMGYEPGSKAYRVYDPTTRRVHISRDVVFDESTQWAWFAEHGGELRDFTMEEPSPVEADTVTTTTSIVPRTTSSTATCSASTSPTTPPPNQYTAGTPAQGSAPATSSPTSSHGVEFASPPSSSLSEQLDNDHDHDVPLRFHRIDNVIGPAPMPGIAARDLEEHLLLARDTEPTSLDEALKHDCWHHAMLDEMTAIEANSTWELVDPPPRVRPIGLKWVYKTKKDAAGIISKYKA